MDVGDRRAAAASNFQTETLLTRSPLFDDGRGRGYCRRLVGFAAAALRRRAAWTARPTARISIEPSNKGSTKNGAPSWLSPATVTARTGDGEHASPRR